MRPSSRGAARSPCTWLSLAPGHGAYAARGGAVSVRGGRCAIELGPAGWPARLATGQALEALLAAGAAGLRWPLEFPPNPWTELFDQSHLSPARIPAANPLSDLRPQAARAATRLPQPRRDNTAPDSWLAHPGPSGQAVRGRADPSPGAGRA